jgi:hypothetical protein
MANKSQSEWRLIIHCITTIWNARVQFISIETLCQFSFVSGVSQRQNPTDVWISSAMLENVTVTEYLYGTPQPPRHRHCGPTNYEYTWSRSVFPKMFYINKPLRLFFTSRGNEGTKKCQLVARGDKSNTANCRRKISGLFRVMFGDFSDTYKFIFFYYTISRGKQSDVVWNHNWETS